MTDYLTPNPASLGIGGERNGAAWSVRGKRASQADTHQTTNGAQWAASHADGHAEAHSVAASFVSAGAAVGSQRARAQLGY